VFLWQFTGKCAGTRRPGWIAALWAALAAVSAGTPETRNLLIPNRPAAATVRNDTVSVSIAVPDRIASASVGLDLLCAAISAPGRVSSSAVWRDLSRTCTGGMIFGQRSERGRLVGHWLINGSWNVRRSRSRSSRITCPVLLLNSFNSFSGTLPAVPASSH
jgi:hypothetical protein